jgi:hypothetical protein
MVISPVVLGEVKMLHLISAVCLFVLMAPLLEALLTGWGEEPRRATRTPAQDAALREYISRRDRELGECGDDSYEMDLAWHRRDKALQTEVAAKHGVEKF